MFWLGGGGGGVGGWGGGEGNDLSGATEMAITVIKVRTV